MSSPATFQFDAIPAGLLPDAGRYLAQAAAWFQGWLYLGITCYPSDPHQPGTALLLRHRPRESGWEALHSAPVESPWIAREGGYRPFPLELGWRALTVLPGHLQPTPTLYAIRLGLRAPALLHTEDGVHFRETPNPGAGGGHGPWIGLHGFSGKVFAVPASAAHDTGRDGAVAHVSADPLTQAWRPACEPGFGDPENRTLDAMQVAHGQLYAATGNPLGGFQLWKTSARGDPPFEWQSVLDEGTQRFTLDPRVETMTVFRDALYLGTRSPRPDPDWEFATSAAEIIRVLPDGRWELVMGTPRFSPVGLQIPLSTHGPGFGDDRNGRIERLAATPDALYAALGRHEPPSAAHPASKAGSFALWKSPDGEDWREVAQTDFAQPAVTRLRVLQPTPHGLVAAGDWDIALDPAARPGIWLERN